MPPRCAMSWRRSSPKADIDGLKAAFDRHRDATKADIDRLAQAIKADFDAAVTRLEAKLGTEVARLDAKIDTVAAQFDAKMDALASRFEMALWKRTAGIIVTTIGGVVAVVGIATGVLLRFPR
jgi:hypothetical protein